MTLSGGQKAALVIGALTLAGLGAVGVVYATKKRGISSKVLGMDIRGSTVAPGPVTVNVTVKNTGTAPTNFAIIIFLLGPNLGSGFGIGTATAYATPHTIKQDTVSCSVTLGNKTGISAGWVDSCLGGWVTYPDDWVCTGTLQPGASATVSRTLTIPGPPVDSVQAYVFPANAIDSCPALAEGHLIGVLQSVSASITSLTAT